MKHIVFRILAGLVLIAAIAGIAFFAFNAGMARGAAASIQLPAVQNGGQGLPFYGMPYWHAFPFFGFGCLGLLIPLFLLCVVFGAARLIMGGPRFGWHRMQHGHGPWSDTGSGRDVPPMFVEMHRRMHAAENEKPADAATQK